VTIRSLEVTGITGEMLATAPKFEDVISPFEEWCRRSQKYVLAVWGAYCDIAVLRSEYRRVGREYGHPGQRASVTGRWMMRSWKRRCSSGWRASRRLLDGWSGRTPVLTFIILFCFINN